MKALGYTVTTIAFVFISVIFSGYVLSILWSWFIVPVFPVSEINIPTAIGIAMIVSYLTYQDIESKKKSESYGWILLEAILKGLLKPAFALLFGWIVTLFL